MMMKHSLLACTLSSILLLSAHAFAQEEGDGIEAYEEAPPPSLQKVETPEVEAVTQQDLKKALLMDIPPQELLFDFKVGDKLLGSIPVKFTDSWVEITEIDAVIDQLNMVKNPELFRGLVKGRIEKGAPREQDGLGTISVDPNRFLVNMEIAKESLIKQELDVATREFQPYDKWVLANSLRGTGNWDFQSDTNDRFALDHITTFGKGRWFFETRGFLPKSEDYQLSDATFNYHFDHSTLKFGLLETVGQDFAFSRNFFGFGLSSELRSYEDLRSLRGSRVELYIPARSQVDIYRGSRILYSRILDFGLQEIDTSRFPSGSYEIRAVITETDGTVTEETLNFSKFLEISPRGKPEYNIQVGISRGANFEIGTSPIVQAEVKWRLFDNTQAELDFYGGKGLGIFEPKFTYFLNDHNRFETTLAYSSAGDAALDLDMYGQGIFEGDTWSVNYSNAFKGFDYDTTNLTSDDFELFLSGQKERLNLSYGSRFADNKAKITLTGSYSDNGEVQTYTYGPRLRFDLIKDRKHTLYSDSRLTMGNGTSRFFTSLTYRRTHRPWRVETSLGRGRYRDHTYWSQRNTLSYDKTAGNGRGTYVQITNDNRQESGAVESRNDLLVRHQTDKTAIRAFARHAAGGNIDNSDSRAVGLELTTSTIWTEGGDKSRLPKISTRGMAIVKLDGDPSIDAEFDILVNGTARAKGRIGESVPVNLAPHETYSITVAATKGADLIKVEDKKEVIGVLPGNIAQLRWRIDKSVLLIGRLLDIDGRPLAWKTIKGLDTLSTTDAFGNFQIELSARNQPFVNVKGKGTCTLAVPELTFGEFYVNIGDMVCV
ncbi:MAG: TcfC E-set like domain-containing protein [Pseudomonadota bacterium]|nr:TcfC E-set like domain-containing protein [Pseudomonadota bacterium]